ncbi:MAG: GntR family transcriptional regulator, partial [Verrucomicrobiota bacterium]
MKSPIFHFVLKQPTEVIRQAGEFVRGLIVSGALEHGEKLPPTSALAASWGVPVASVHAALAGLVQR